MKPRLAAVLATTLLAAPAWAAPPDKAACIAAFDRAQRSATDLKLRQARTDLLVCTNEACPAVLRKDCAGVLAQIENLMPSIVLAASGDKGQDVTDVTVAMNGEVVSTKLDGKAIDVDPGAYTVRFTWRNQSREEKVAIREGEKSRVIMTSFEEQHVVGSSPPPPSAEPEPKRSTVGWVVPSALAGLGVAGLAIAGISRLRFDAQVSDDRAAGGCAPDCTQSHRDDLSKTLVTANVALVSGLALLGGAVIGWIVLGPSSPSRGSTAALAW